MEVLQPLLEDRDLLNYLAILFQRIDRTTLDALAQISVELIPVLIQIINAISISQDDTNNLLLKDMPLKDIDRTSKTNKYQIIHQHSDIDKIVYKHIDHNNPENTYTFESNELLTTKKIEQILSSEHHKPSQKIVSTSKQSTLQSYPRGPLSSQVVLSTILCNRSIDDTICAEIIIRLAPRGNLEKISSSSIHIISAINT